MVEYEPKDLIGNKIKDIFVDGYGVEIIMEDGLKFMYDASDGGYSSWGVVEINDPVDELF